MRMRRTTKRETAPQCRFWNWGLGLKKNMASSKPQPCAPPKLNPKLNPKKKSIVFVTNVIVCFFLMGIQNINEKREGGVILINLDALFLGLISDAVCAGWVFGERWSLKIDGYDFFLSPFVPNRGFFFGRWMSVGLKIPEKMSRVVDA